MNEDTTTQAHDSIARKAARIRKKREWIREHLPEVHQFLEGMRSEQSEVEVPPVFLAEEGKCLPHDFDQANGEFILVPCDGGEIHCTVSHGRLIKADAILDRWINRSFQPLANAALYIRVIQP